jgi:hypothetical protein
MIVVCTYCSLLGHLLQYYNIYGRNRGNYKYPTQRRSGDLEARREREAEGVGERASRSGETTRSMR